MASWKTDSKAESTETHDTILTQILEVGRTAGEIEEHKRISESSLILFATGLVVDSRLDGCDIKKEIDMFLDMLFPSNEKDKK